jgi:uncharacterized membrane protein (UPF0127 family)
MTRVPPSPQQPDVLLDASARLVSRIRRAAVVMLVLGVFGFLIVGANRPANPRLLPPLGAVKEASFKTFGAISFRVSAAPGLSSQNHPSCALLARTPAQQARGLMTQTSLHRYAGMIFQFSQPTSQAFYMKDTVIPLSIAWFDASGTFVAEANMKPCPPTTVFCSTYEAGPKFQLAIEVPEGKLTSLGIGPGSILHLTGPCTG